MKPHDYRDLIAAYIDANYARRGIIVYTEVALGKTIIGKNRQRHPRPSHRRETRPRVLLIHDLPQHRHRSPPAPKARGRRFARHPGVADGSQLDILALRRADQRALGIECKYQDSQGTTDEKIPYALQDLEAMWIPGCLAYAGSGWSKGVLHTLEGSRLGVYCLPERPDLARSLATRELDHVLAAVFGLWDVVIPEERLFSKDPQLTLMLRGGPKKVAARPVVTPKKVADDEG